MLPASRSSLAYTTEGLEEYHQRRQRTASPPLLRDVGLKNMKGIVW